MGFLKFLKKKEAAPTEKKINLEAPPAPPEIEEPPELPDFPEITGESEEDIIKKVNVEKEKPAEPEFDIEKEFDFAPREDKITGPFYISSLNYQKIMGRIKTTRAFLKNSSDKLIPLNDLKDKEDKQFKNYKGILEDIQRKLIFIDKTLFEGDK